MATSTISEIFVMWTYQMNGTEPRIGAEIEVYKEQVLIRNFTVGAAYESTIISLLNPLTRYIVTIYAISTIGRSLPSSIEYSTLSLSKLYKIIV